MPRARTGGGTVTAWAATPVPATPKARNAYLDLCTQYLIAAEGEAVVTSGAEARAEEEEEGKAWGARTTWTPPGSGGGGEGGRGTETDRVLARTPSEWRAHLSLSCVACGEERRRGEGGRLDGLVAVTANPFAPRCLVAVCDACAGA